MYAQNSYFAKINTRKKYAQQILINSAFLDSINNNSFFHRDLPVFPLILVETLAEYPFDSNIFFLFFFIWG